jgi:hypothetical protein
LTICKLLSAHSLTHSLTHLYRLKLGSDDSSSEESSSSVDWAGRRVKDEDRERRSHHSRATTIQRTLGGKDPVSPAVARSVLLPTPTRGRSTKKRAPAGGKKKEAGEADRAMQAVTNKVARRFAKGTRVLDNQLVVHRWVRRARTPSTASTYESSETSSKTRRSRAAAASLHELRAGGGGLSFVLSFLVVVVFFSRFFLFFGFFVFLLSK